MVSSLSRVCGSPLPRSELSTKGTIEFDHQSVAGLVVSRRPSVTVTDNSRQGNWASRATLTFSHIQAAAGVIAVTTIAYSINALRTVRRRPPRITPARARAAWTAPSWKDIPSAVELPLDAPKFHSRANSCHGATVWRCAE